jgi:signal transduction histidine kinase
MICYLFPEPTYFLFTSGVPALLYYSYIPVTIVALFVGFYIFFSDRSSLLNKLFLAITVLFSFWAISILIEWTNIHSNLVLFVWNFQGIIFGLTAILCIYFMYVFLDKKDVSNLLKVVFLTLLTPIFILTPNYYLSGFDITACDAFEFQSTAYQIYYIALGVLAIFWVLTLIIRRYRISDADFKKQISLMGNGILAFLFMFFIWTNLTYYLSQIGALPDSQLEMYGMFGVLIFIVYIGIIMVRFKTFNTKTFGAQMLVFALIALIGSQFFYTTNTTSMIVTSITLVVTGIIGINLIRSVKKEIEAKEALKIANERQAETTSLITHQIRGVFTTTKAGLSAVIDGSYGSISQDLKGVMEHMFKSQEDGVTEVQTFLQAQKIESGTVQYDFKPFDFKALVEELSDKEKPRADAKGFQYEVHIDNGDYIIEGDLVYLTQLVDNFIDNAIRYTEKGSIKIQLSRKTNSILYSVKDSGVGIKEEDRDKIFTKYGHGTDSRKINSDSSGLGLYIVKGIVVGHGGKIWYETEIGKGTTFFAKLPIKQTLKR